MSNHRYGEIFYYKPTYNPTGYDPVQILHFDEERKKYLCFVFDMDGTSDTWHLGYISEQDLGKLSEINENESKWMNQDGSPRVPENLDTRYFGIYDYEKMDTRLIQRAVGKRKNTYDLPVQGVRYKSF